MRSGRSPPWVFGAMGDLDAASRKLPKLLRLRLALSENLSHVWQVRIPDSPKWPTLEG